VLSETKKYDKMLAINKMLTYYSRFIVSTNPAQARCTPYNIM